MRFIFCDPAALSLVLLYRKGTQRSCAIDTDETFDALFAAYERPICAYLTRLTGDGQRAQELAQETFVRAYRALLRGERWENARAWLYRVASRLATDDYRRRQLIRWLPLWESDEHDDGVEGAVVERVAVRRALRALPARYRVPLVLYTCEEWSVAEVAEALHLSQSAVKMRLCRAREMFRGFYEEDV